ncbi:MAG: iron-containing alcohol dehydrogenase [Bacteroidales bacterium]|nr:iron-containing alcohol dehydrogenase [Bacteroidales bacterium]
MENFQVFNPTSLHFGKDVTKKLQDTVLNYGNNVMLIYGKGSIVKNGIYDKIKAQLNNVKITEYNGIKPNPVVDDVNKAVLVGIENKVEVIVAVGGGSVIDSAKIISLCIPEKLDAWDVMKNIAKPEKSIPLIAVLTIAATGTEMNPYAVLQNHETYEKIGYGNELIFPKHSFLDPEFTYSVPKNHTAYGITDLIAHSLEAYFGFGDATLSDRFTTEIIKEAIYYGPLLLNDLKNYDYRAKIMWAATCALNGLTSYGRTSEDWGAHDIGHILSFLYDIPHGATLSIVYPAWLKLHKDRIPERIIKLGNQLFNINSIDETINKLKDFFISINCPVKLSEIGIGKDKKNEIIDLMNKNKVNGFNHKLSSEDYEMLVDFMY